MRSPGKYLGIYLILTGLGLALFFLDLLLGSVKIPASEVFQILGGNEPSRDTWITIVQEFRLPKAITAFFVGGGLALSGLQMQTLFRNPLAGPFVLGISSGASLGVALMILAGGAGFMLSSGILASWVLVSAAILGSSLVFLLVISVSFRVKDSTSLLILGLMFSSVTGAVVTILQYFSQAEELQSFMIWTFGNLGGNSWDELSILIPILMFGIMLSFLGIKNLNALLLGEQYALSMGMNTTSTRIWIIVTTCILAGSITAFCGPIAFVGLAVPHMTRMIFKTSNHKHLIPASFLVGAIIMLICDIIAQLPGSQAILPINAITSLIGAPFVIWLIMGRQRNRPISI